MIQCKTKLKLSYNFFLHELNLPIMQIGFRIKRNRPRTPIYLDRQPADQSLTIYSTPKNATRHISCV